MRVIRTVAEQQAWSDARRAAGRSIALVPTMGALHAGHLSLVELPRARADAVVVSIFVNPTQFDDPADLRAYPRTGEADLEACRRAGVAAVFAPEAEDLYPQGFQTTVEVGALALPLCGASRPGHFRGVATVVAKLLVAVRPHVAVFGEKDWQQLAVIRRMVRDLGLDVEVAGGPIVREPDGLALSSRNASLDPEARRQARVLSRALAAAERAVRAGETRRAALLHLVRTEIEKAPRARIDYAELCDPEDLTPSPETLVGPALLALAVFLDPPGGGSGASVRLIDNRLLHPEPTGGTP